MSNPPFAIIVAWLFPVSLLAGITPGSKNIGAVWCVGDSITLGDADGDANGSPRKSIHSLLIANGYTFTFTGHSTASVDGLPTTGTSPETNLFQYHSGISGSASGNDAAAQPDITQDLANFWTSGRLATVKPQVVLIMLGTDEIDADIDRAAAPSRLAGFLDALYGQPGVGSPTVFVANIPPNRSAAGKPAWVAEFNAEIPGIVGAQRALGRDVHFVDQFTPIENDFSALMQGDNLHTNAAGNAILAQQWFNKISAVVSGAVATGTGPLVPLGDSISAETNNSAAAGAATAGYYASGVLADDLINTSQPSLASVQMDKAPSTAVSPGTAAMNDGIGYPATDSSGSGALIPVAYGSGGKTPFTYTVTLDTALSGLGYEISQVRSFAGWHQSGSCLANQKYEVLVSHVGDPAFVSLGTYTYTPFNHSHTAEAAASRLILAAPDGVIASRVDQLRFVFEDPGFDNGLGPLDGTVYHEIDVIGTAMGNRFSTWADRFGIPANDQYDGDHDGISALMEYALGFSPQVSEVQPSLNASGSSISWTKGAESAVDPEISYAVKVSDDLKLWEAPTAGELLETVTGLSLNLTVTGTKRFARLEVTRTVP